MQRDSIFRFFFPIFHWPKKKKKKKKKKKRKRKKMEIPVEVLSTLVLSAPTFQKIKEDVSKDFQVSNPDLKVIEQVWIDRNGKQMRVLNTPSCDSWFVSPLLPPLPPLLVVQRSLVASIGTL